MFGNDHHGQKSLRECIIIVVIMNFGCLICSSTVITEFSAVSVDEVL